jgi:hypothetical protein
MTIYELDYNSDIVKKLEAQYERWPQAWKYMFELFINAS